MIAELLTTAACVLAGHGEMILPTCTPWDWRARYRYYERRDWP
jgi:hypothetical protein